MISWHEQAFLGPDESEMNCNKINLDPSMDKHLFSNAVWNVITYQFPNFYIWTIEVPHFTRHAIAYPCLDGS